MDIREAYKFCPRCGHRFEHKSGFLSCPNCSLSLYINPKPTTTVVLINTNGHYLLVKRAVEPAKGYWDFPGGFVEDNETFEENGRREIKEELDIKIGQLHYAGSITAPYMYQDINYPTLAIIFVSKMPRDTRPKPADDVASYSFFAPDKLPLDRLAFPSMKKSFMLVAEFLKNSRL